jgi:uncharacterized protein (TIGR00251 family)
MNPLPPFVKRHADGVSLRLRIVPRSSRNELGEILGDRLKVKIAAPPVDSAANEELVRFLAGRLGVARGAVLLSQGLTSRNKTVFVQGLPAEAVPGLIAARPRDD